MTDQAEKLREMIAKAKKDREKSGPPSSKKASKPRAEIIAISSGKGGVGKTNISLNLGIALSKMGRKVVIIDADLGLANIDIISGLIPKYNLFHVLDGKRSLEDVVLEGPGGVNIISGGSGIKELANLSEDRLEKLISSLETLYESHDYMILDTGAGISESVLSFIRAASRLIMVLTPDLASISDAYSLIKNVYREQTNIACIINRVESKNEALYAFDKLSRMMKRFLSTEPLLLGYMMEDHHVVRAVREQNPFLLSYPNSVASSCVKLMAHTLEGESEEVKSKLSFGGFIKKLFKS